MPVAANETVTHSLIYNISVLMEGDNLGPWTRSVSLSSWCRYLGWSSVDRYGYQSAGFANPKGLPAESTSRIPLVSPTAKKP